MRQVGQHESMRTATTSPHHRHTHTPPQPQLVNGSAPGAPVAFAGVYDGHGGSAVADWLKAGLFPIVEKKWSGARPEASITEAYLEADKELLSARNGFMGMGESSAAWVDRRR